MAENAARKAKNAPRKRGASARPVFSHFAKRTRAKTSMKRNAEIFVHTMHDAIDGVAGRRANVRAAFSFHRSFAVAGRLSAFFLFAFVAVAASALVIRTVDAATFQEPTQAAPLGNIPITIWNRNAATGTQTNAAIAIDGNGATASPSPQYGLSVSSDTLVLPSNANLFYGNISGGNADGSSSLALFRSGGTSVFRVNTLGDLKLIKGVPYTWPAAQGAAGTTLVNDGAGNLSWATSAGGGTACTIGGMFDHLTATTAMGGQYGNYDAVNVVCASGTHICSAEEILRTINCAKATLPSGGVQAWIAAGPPGFTFPAVNDCAGWSSSLSTSFGALWQFEGTTGGKGYATACNSPLKTACCK